MGDYPTGVVLPLRISTWSRYITGLGARAMSIGAPVSITYPIANMATYVPMFLPWAYPVRRVYWVNGATAAGNSDIGIYSFDGARIWSSGSTANSGASTQQFVTVSGELLLSPGPYYLAYVNDGTTTRSFGASGANQNSIRLLGVMQQSSALPLPAAASFALWAGGAYFPLLGITRTASGF